MRGGSDRPKRNAGRPVKYTEGGDPLAAASDEYNAAQKLLADEAQIEAAVALQKESLNARFADASKWIKIMPPDEFTTSADQGHYVEVETLTPSNWLPENGVVVQNMSIEDLEQARKARDESQKVAQDIERVLKDDSIVAGL